MDEIRKAAHQASEYYKTLVADGIPPRQASELAAAYILGVLCSNRAPDRESREPWQESLEDEQP